MRSLLSAVSQDEETKEAQITVHVDVHSFEFWTHICLAGKYLGFTLLHCWQEDLWEVVEEEKEEMRKMLQRADPGQMETERD